MANLSGPRPETLARIDRVRLLLLQGNKLCWALKEVGLGTFQWYSWAGKERKVYQRREVVAQKAEDAALLVAGGFGIEVAARAVRLSPWTLRHRLKRREAARG